MARKRRRKSRVADPPQEPQLVQPTEPDHMEEELKDDVADADQEKAEKEAEVADNPSQNAVSENGDEAKEPNAEGEEELEEEPLEKVLKPFSKDQLTLLIKEAVAKHPDVMEGVNKLANEYPAPPLILIHGLDSDANTDLITSVFGKYGEIEECEVVKDNITGKSMGYGFILYKQRDGACRALKERQKMINGGLVTCQPAFPGRFQTPPRAAAASIQTPPVSEYTQRRIYVSNVTAKVDTNRLLEFFSKFGEIEDGPWGLLGFDKETGEPTGYWLLVYKSVESAKKVLEEPRKNFEGHILHCRMALEPGQPLQHKHLKHSKSHFNQQRGQPQQHQHLKHSKSHFNQQPGQPQQHQHPKHSKSHFNLQHVVDVPTEEPLLWIMGAYALFVLVLSLTIWFMQISINNAK